MIFMFLLFVVPGNIKCLSISGTHLEHPTTTRVRIAMTNTNRNDVQTDRGKTFEYPEYLFVFQKRYELKKN